MESGPGSGKTAGRGHKGKGSRSGGNTPPGYEGGQMPLKRRVPKRGFRRLQKAEDRREEFVVVNLRRLAALARRDGRSGADGRARNNPRGGKVKVLGDGDAGQGRMTIRAHAFSVECEREDRRRPEEWRS